MPASAIVQRIRAAPAGHPFRSQAGISASRRIFTSRTAGPFDRDAPIDPDAVDPQRATDHDLDQQHPRVRLRLRPGRNQRIARGRPVHPYEYGSPLAKIRPNTIGYVGGYYQWPNNWKFTGRVGIQSFEGAQLLSLTPVQPFTQPIIRLDIDRMDDNDNRLFGVTAEIMWVAKPAYQSTLRTPLYAVRH